MFRDITPLLADPEAFRRTIKHFADRFRDENVTAVAAAEARGFIFAAPLALELDAGFVPVRKPGKLPRDVHSFAYELEYGTDSLEMHIDALDAGDRVVVVDDLLATGGTVAACLEIIEQTGAVVVGCAFVIELDALQGHDKLRGYDVFSLVHY
jgi:adenine phosphoribosyltransferase